MDLPHSNLTELLNMRNVAADPGVPGMSESCSVAVVVPFFDEENHISRCLQSLVNQRLDSGDLFTSNQFEIICVNNNSTDGSTSIVSEFIAAHPDYRIFQVDEPRQGPAWARNKGVETAISRFAYSSRSLNESIIAWIDGDSEAGENWLVEIVKAFQNPEVMAAAGEMVRTYTPIFTRSDDEFISKNMGVLRKVTKERWKELFIIHMDGCIKNLVTRDVINAISRGRNIQSIAEEIYGGQWRLVTEKIRQGLDELPEENSGSLRFANGFLSTPEQERLTNKIFQISRCCVWTWLWSGYCVSLDLD